MRCDFTRMMRRKRTLIFFLFLFRLPFLHAQITYLKPFSLSASPVISAQGNSSIANAEGLGSLASNPAGLTMGEDKQEWTLLSLSGAAKTAPEDYDFLLSVIRNGIAGNTSAILSNLLGRQTSYGLSAGLSFGYAGRIYRENYLGVGVFGSGTFEFRPGGILSTVISLGNLNTLSLGYAHKFYIGDLASLSFGVNVRPMLLLKFDNLSLGNYSQTRKIISPPRPAFTAGLDVGLLLEISRFRVGLVLRDVLDTVFIYRDSGVNHYFVTPQSLHIGLAYMPYINEFQDLISMKFHVSQSFLLPVKPQGIGYPRISLLNYFGLGMEVKLFSLLALRGGIRGGYLTGGIGLLLGPLRLNVSYYSVEQGRYLGEDPRHMLSAGLELVL